MNPTTGIAAILIALLAAGSYWWGDHNCNNEWLARLALQERAASKALQAEVARSDLAEKKYIESSQTLQNSYSTLEGKFNELRLRGPLVVYRAAAAVPGVGASAAGGAAPATAGGDAVKAVGAEPGLAGEAHHGAGDADAGLGLSLGAVWLWNSALTGTDTPAGACSAADTASAACAADSGLGLADAWANHQANARACASDRLRHRQLIDYINHQPEQPAP